MARTLKDFRAKHDPTHRVEFMTQTFKRAFKPGTKRFVITAAQNGTPVHPVFWRVLNRICEDAGAELLVIPLRYKNPTSQWTGSQQNAEHWAAEVQPYLWNVRHALHKNLTLLADIKTQPTAESPLSGFDAVSLAASGIVGHTKLQLRSIPTPSGRMAKVLTTTGACTVANYTDTKTGRIGEFHHSLSAVMVELDGPRFHLRQLQFHANRGRVIDLGTMYSDKLKCVSPPALALAMGDTHVDYADPAVIKATFGPGGIVETCRPRNLVWHDVCDSYSVNPHHLGNPFIAFAKRKAGRDNVAAEVGRAIEFIKTHTPKGCASHVVPSNHNDFISRYLSRTDWRSDPTNAEFYLETALHMVHTAKVGPKGTEYADPFMWWLKRAQLTGVNVLGFDESLKLGDVELAMHGDIGPNGARGSIRNLRRIGTKSIIGHSHSPGIDEGCYQTGTSTRLRLEYNHGASSWLNCHGLLNADGKRQLLIIVDGHWHLPRGQRNGTSS